jgi:hypothetical protein
MQPFFEEIARCLKNQYELRFSAPLEGKPTTETLKLKVSVAGDVAAPQMVFVDRAGATE